MSKKLDFAKAKSFKIDFLTSEAKNFFIHLQNFYQGSNS